MSTSNQQELFLRRLSEIGSLDVCLEEFHLAKFQIAIWLEDADFKKAYETARNFYIKHLNDEVAIKGLQRLNHVLNYGEETTTVSHTKHLRYIATVDGVEPHEETKDTKTKKINKNPSWAVLAAVRLHIEQQRQNTTIGALQTLINEGLLPDHVLQRVTGILERAEQEVHGVLGSEIQTQQFSRDDLAQIMRDVIGG